MSLVTCSTCKGRGTRTDYGRHGYPCQTCAGTGTVPGPHYVTLCQTPADQIVFLLRHLGPQRERDLIDSLGVPIATVRQAITGLVAARRIERHGPDRWRLIPTPAAPTANPGT